MTDPVVKNVHDQTREFYNNFRQTELLVSVPTELSSEQMRAIRAIMEHHLVEFEHKVVEHTVS